MRLLLILTFVLFSIHFSFSQKKEEIFKREGHNYSTTYSYDVDLLILNPDDNSYRFINQSYISKKMMRKNVIFDFDITEGTYLKDKDKLLLKEKNTEKELVFSFLSKNKLVRLVENNEKSKVIWKKVIY